MPFYADTVVDYIVTRMLDAVFHFYKTLTFKDVGEKYKIAFCHNSSYPMMNMRYHGKLKDILEMGNLWERQCCTQNMSV